MYHPVLVIYLFVGFLIWFNCIIKYPDTIFFHISSDKTVPELIKGLCIVVYQMIIVMVLWGPGFTWVIVKSAFVKNKDTGQ